MQPLRPGEKKEEEGGREDRDTREDGKGEKEGKNGNTCSTIPGLVIQPTHEQLEGKIKKGKKIHFSSHPGAAATLSSRFETPLDILSLSFSIPYVGVGGRADSRESVPIAKGRRRPASEGGRGKKDHKDGGKKEEGVRSFVRSTDEERTRRGRR